MTKTRKKGYSRKLLLLASLFLIFLGFNNLKTRPTPIPKVLGAEVSPKKEILHWENFVTKNPTYVDALVRLALLEAEAENSAKSKSYFRAAYKLSPNAKNVIEAKKTLGF